MSTTTRPDTASTTAPAKFLDPLFIPPRLTPPAADSELTLTTRAVPWQLHSQLPPTPLWTYEGTFPGPTIEVRRGQRIRVRWTNGVTGTYPAVDAHLDDAPGNPSLTMNDPGLGAAKPVAGTADLPAWLVTHLHGAVTGGGNDGWTENAVLTGDSQLSEYPDDQAATALWYHDHAVDITRLNVYSGLVGMYLVRDEEEDALHLPSGDQEVPLVLCDRNLMTDQNGALTGQLLHKTSGTLPFLGPYTLVNGRIWPHHEVRPRWYRFRLLNASNSRVFRLHLLDASGASANAAAWQIGTDSGLLGAPIPVPQSGLILAPSERADILVDFGPFAGQSLRLVNSAQAPFRGDPLPPGVKPGDPLPSNRLPEPDVMEFRVAATDPGGPDPFPLPARLSPSFVRLTHDTLPEHEHRLLLLAADRSGTLGLWEMAQVPDSSAPTQPGETIDGIVQLTDDKGVTTTWQRKASRFDDTLNWEAKLDGWEQWRILNVSGILHPIHIHLIRFQVLSIDQYDTAKFLQPSGGTATSAPVSYLGADSIPADEQGWKDVIRVPLGAMVSLAGQFRGATGRFMYHCHILEHEDAGMMRAFRVVPAPLAAVDPMPPMASH